MHVNPLAVPTLLLAAVMFWLGIWAERRLRSAATRIVLIVFFSVLALPGFAFFLFYTHLFEKAVWFYNFRTMRFTELCVAGVGLLIGFAHSAFEPETLGEKLVGPATLFAVVLIPFSKPLLSPLDYTQLRPRCEGDVCLQSTMSTCGPASAATLLRAAHVDASEQELARECFTYQGGTENWYLARALRRRGFQTEFVVADHIAAPPSPSIAGVKLPGGSGHFIAVLGTDGDQVKLVDPLVGKVTIPKSELKRRYSFTGLYLVVRKRN